MYVKCEQMYVICQQMSVKCTTKSPNLLICLGVKKKMPKKEAHIRIW